MLGVGPDLFPVDLVVTLEWFDAELPRACNACVLLHAVGVSPVVDFDGFEVCLPAYFLECRETSLGLVVDEELDVPGALFTFLELATDVRGVLGPHEQVLLRVYVGIV